jgi:hypothetical protein
MDNFFSNSILGQVISGKWEETLCHSSIPKDKEDVLTMRMPLLKSKGC